MNLIHCEVLIKEHTQLQQARVSNSFASSCGYEAG